MQASITTVSPPAFARAAASSLAMPVCSHSAFAPIFTASSAIGRRVLRAPEDVDDVDALGHVDERRIRSLAEDLGFARVDGDDAVARLLQLLHDAVYDALSGLDEAPTMAIVVALVRSSFSS